MDVRRHRAQDQGAEGGVIDGKRPRRMATLDQIVEFWSNTGLIEQGNFIGWGEPFCFACEWLAPSPHPYEYTPWGLSGWLVRGHLQDHCQGGEGTVDNLVPLCWLCNDAMPPFDDLFSAFDWVQKFRGTVPLKMYWQIYTDCNFSGENFLKISTASMGLKVMKRVRLRFLEGQAQLEHKYVDF